LKSAIENHLNAYYRHGERVKCSRWFSNLKWCLWYSLSEPEKKLVGFFVLRLVVTSGCAQGEAIDGTARDSVGVNMDAAIDAAL
jgi:hypothetical protein